MNELLFIPDDVLFFRDGRPMAGSLSGHGARLPEPHVMSGALHAACHRAFPNGSDVGKVHRRRPRRKSVENSENKSGPIERFGALTSIGPFPVRESDGVAEWFFPVPADLTRRSLEPGLVPVAPSALPGESSLPEGLWPLAGQFPPSKDPVPQWLSKTAFEAYLRGERVEGGFLETERIFASEATIGIGMNPESGSTAEGAFYSKSQLRLHREFRLGSYAALPAERDSGRDLLASVFPENGRISLGGESRICSVSRSEVETLSLPVGPEVSGKYLKWVLLTPAIFPFLEPNSGRDYPHPGGWLPSWIDPKDFSVRLLDGPGAKKARRLNLEPGKPISANLVAAAVLGNIPITGWGLGDGERSGARSTLLGVPAGTVYYFEAENEKEVEKLAAVLNWHGDPKSPVRNRIVNRCSALMGEKGYGIGICGSWKPETEFNDVG